VVKKLHHNNANTLTRCALMIAAPSQDWNVFQQIFVEHWDGFTRVYPRYHTPYYDDLVDKMLRCGNPDQMGYIAYRCLHCGQGTHRVAMSCKIVAVLALCQSVRRQLGQPSQPDAP
jgi:hypothetical protein